MLGLVLVPCSDTCNSHEHETPTTLQSEFEHHEEDDNSCSPFCNCSCCSTAVVLNANVAGNLIESIATPLISFISQSFLSEENYAIWQPPKFS